MRRSGRARVARPVIRRHAVGRSGGARRRGAPAPARRVSLPSAVGRGRRQRAAVSQGRNLSRLPLRRAARHRRSSRKAQHAVRDPRRRLLPRPQLPGDRARRRVALASTRCARCAAATSTSSRRARSRCSTASWTDGGQLPPGDRGARGPHRQARGAGVRRPRAAGAPGA